MIDTAVGAPFQIQQPMAGAEATTIAKPHILLFEPRVEGHHLGYLKAITETLLGADYQLTLAVNTDPEAYAQIRIAIADSLGRVKIIPAEDASSGRGKLIDRIAALFEDSHADLVFLPNLDEIGSNLLRRAALGFMPPESLRGRLGGIYHRPRFLGPLGPWPNSWLKAAGFKRLLRGHWFSHVLFVDPYLHAQLKADWPDAPAFFLPDFFPMDFPGTGRAEARRELDLPADKRIFLLYGSGGRRKGLGLAVEAMLATPETMPAFLLCAGQQAADRNVVRGLDVLERQGRARRINRYISDDEERQLFAASDIVLLPYRRHFPISGVLIRAIGAGLPVVVSDEGLIGRLVRDYGIGLLFPSGEARALARAIEQAAQAKPEQLAQWRAAAREAAPHWTLQAFAAALNAAFNHARLQLDRCAESAARHEPGRQPRS